IRPHLETLLTSPNKDDQDALNHVETVFRQAKTYRKMTGEFGAIFDSIQGDPIKRKAGEAAANLLASWEVAEKAGGRSISKQMGRLKDNQTHLDLSAKTLGGPLKPPMKWIGQLTEKMVGQYYERY